jgi:predicted nucleotidyltransferase
VIDFFQSAAVQSERTGQNMKSITIEERKKALHQELDRIIGIIIKKYRPERIVLFGSLANDNVHEWSDIDLLIVKETDKRPVERNIEVFRMTRPTVGIDLFIYTPQEFQSLIEERYSFILNILKAGRTVYEKGS